MKSLKWFERRTDETAPEMAVYDPSAPLEERLAGWRETMMLPRKREIFDRTAATIDRDAYAALQREYRDQLSNADSASHAKYLDIARWLAYHTEFAFMLNIDMRKPCSVLNLGAISGQLLAITNAFGHDSIALDMNEREIHRDILELLGIDSIRSPMRLRQPLPAELGKFDVIVSTTQFIGFDVATWQPWTLEDWAGFLEYLCGHHVRYPAEIFIGLRKSIKLEDGQTDYLWPLIDLAEKHGALTVRERAYILFRLDAPLRFDEIDHERWPAP
ncbi:hypothetical protein [Parasphingopyxis sp.]|uniref:hypothetical protein n=1 Tax=Parasphingopyxis sp. TaxID=1920299 RepID=UPI002617798F|nr:hypothetical protein [Parasphingopyxis sp.]